MTSLSRIALAAVLVVGTAHLAPPALAQKATTAAAEAGKTTSKPASVCKGLSQSACTANKSCGWVTPKKKVASNGRKLSPYCRTVAGVAKKK